MTANTTATTAPDDLGTSPATAAYERYRDRAEHLLRRVATACEAVFDAVDDPIDFPDYVMNAATTAGKALVQLAGFEAAREQQTAAREPDLIIDVLGENWFAEHDAEGSYAAGDDPAKVFSADYIRRSWGPTREYVLWPPRPAS